MIIGSLSADMHEIFVKEQETYTSNYSNHHLKYNSLKYLGKYQAPNKKKNIA